MVFPWNIFTNISNIKVSDISDDFCIKVNISRKYLWCFIIMQKIKVIPCFSQILDRGWFWLHPPTNQRPSKSPTTKRLTIGFLVPKMFPCQFLDQNNHFIEFYCVFGQFWTILGTIGGQWRHKRGKDFKMLKFWHHHRFFSSQKMCPC